jgi:hypothetical protein
LFIEILLRGKADGGIFLFRPPEHERDRLMMIGISRLGTCGDRFVADFVRGTTGFSLRKSVDRYEENLIDGFSSI